MLFNNAGMGAPPLPFSRVDLADVTFTLNLPSGVSVVAAGAWMRSHRPMSKRCSVSHSSSSGDSCGVMDTPTCG